MGSRPQLSSNDTSHAAPRVRPGWLSDATLFVGLLSSAWLIFVVARVEGTDVDWVIMTLALLGAAIVVRLRRPDHPLTGWLSIVGGLAPLGEVLGGLLFLAASNGESSWLVAGVNFAAQVLAVVSSIATVYLLGLFPDGAVRHIYERRILRGVWWFLLIPGLLVLMSAQVPLPYWFALAPVENPMNLFGASVDMAVVELLTGMTSAIFVLGVAMLVLRYRRSGQAHRKRIRWLSIPAVIGAFVVFANLLIGLPNWFASAAFSAVGISLGIALALGVLDLPALDVDVLLRRTTLYGLLWLLIAAAYVGIATVLGMAAGRRLSIGWAVTLAVGAMLALQPVRRRLENAADRWIFGVKPDPTEAIISLGSTLADTYELESLLPRIEAVLREGLGLEWARVSLDPAESAVDESSTMTVPIVLGGEQLGLVVCGPKINADLTDEDRAVVKTLVRQAALAVRNVRLASQLADQAAELDASRARLVRAEEAERRRIERNIHDGVQQELVALIGQAGHVRTQLDRNREAVGEELALLQDGMERVLSDLRELASGIHPSLLRDRGLLPAVEALAARNLVPVVVRADPSLLDLRLAEELEGAGYYIIAESLANSLKHADASRIEVTLTRSNGRLLITVSDDGNGFEQPLQGGNGLANLSERLAALGGELDVTSSPGQGTTVSASLSVASREEET
jgi:signal transduction histidine kinase